MIQFNLIHTDGKARRGVLHTPHGDIQTPVFMPVGTAGTVKSLTSQQILDSGSQIILCNTYHLYLRPGTEVLEHYGGIHNFMDWHKPILTDSGGFQVFSLSKGLTKLSEDGVTFKSHIDGSSHFLTPEKSIEIQKVIGADIIMAFDELVRDEETPAYAREASERTIRWLDRCVKKWKEIDPEGNQSLFGIVQGGIYKDLRKESVQQILERNLPGIAIGGETIGYNKEKTKEVLEWIVPYIPENTPRYTMGVGDIDDIFAVVERGVDMFDCVSPTRMARNGGLLISPSEGGNRENKYRLRITNAEFAMDVKPIDKTCTCYTCKNYSRGYLNHLFKSGELLANTLATIHNVTFMANLMSEIRNAIEHDTFHELHTEWVS
jgi:queuine tRNA-ribosyltransferase